VQRVRMLGLAYLLLGVIELAWCMFCVFGGALLVLVGGAAPELGQLRWIGGGAYGLLAIAALMMGVAHCVSGALLRRGRGVVPLVIGFAACLPSLVLALYCAPFALVAIGCTIYVLADPEARKALDA
jgi:hypothetical protein